MIHYGFTIFDTTPQPQRRGIREHFQGSSEEAINAIDAF